MTELESRRGVQMDTGKADENALEDERIDGDPADELAPESMS